MTKISDIKVMSPGDKLVIVFKENVSNVQMESVKGVLDDFTKKKGKYLCVVNSSCDVYIMKKGSKVLLKDLLNKQIKEKK